MKKENMVEEKLYKFFEDSDAEPTEEETDDEDIDADLDEEDVDDDIEDDEEGGGEE